jgi:leucyl-tRNA synthetase
MTETVTPATGPATTHPDDVHRYNHTLVEPKWRQKWAEAAIYKAEDDDPREKWFSLTMFPYPSGVLHVGHWFAFAIPDSFARLQRMRGYNVLFPMGFDSFGLPAENAAIRYNIPPSKWTVENIAQMREQFEKMGTTIDWSRELATSDPAYYRWNQWIFLKMLEKGLAYRAKGPVWWCPNDQTVLANEQVLEGNICERCGHEVYRRDLEQWYLRITDYAEELLTGLETIDWPERVRTMQRNWIGKSTGATLVFHLESGDDLEVFTTRPDTVFGATFMVLAPEHELVEKLTTPEQRDAVAAYVTTAKNTSEIERLSTAADRKKTGVFTGAYAVNPLTEKRIPVWVADYVLATYGTGAIMAVPAHDERDFAFARALDLPIRVVIQPDGVELDPETMTEAYVGPGSLVNSGEFNGSHVPEDLPAVIERLDSQGRGKATVTYRLRDWLFARQRYWGTPLPIIYCDSCGIVPVPEDQLPVILPLDAEFQPTGQSPLQNHEEFLHTECPQCGGPARRETDTMDTFVDSSWYWYRYTSPHDSDAPFDEKKSKLWTPVDLYCGGIEHAILHLLYARFFTKFLRDIGLVDHDEPFQRLRNQGMILSEEGVKMSKSRGTQVGPDELVEQYGADALRLHLMFLGPWEQGGPWNDRGITGMERFMRRAFQVVSEVGERKLNGAAPEGDTAALRALLHRTIKKVTADIDRFQFNTAIAALIEFTNELVKQRESALANAPVWREAAETLTLLMAPLTPYIAEEMWNRLGKPFSVHQQSWPTFDEALATDRTVEIPVQINGKVREKVTVASDSLEADVVIAAKALVKIQEYLDGKTIVKTIFVPNRLLNFVVN